MGPFRGYPCRANVQDLDYRIYYVHNAAKIMIVIGSLGIIISFILIGSSTDDLTEVAAEDIYWGDWIVYQGENDAIYLDESIGYTVYVDNSNDCSVSVRLCFKVPNTTNHIANLRMILIIGCNWETFTPRVVDIMILRWMLTSSFL